MDRLVDQQDLLRMDPNKGPRPPAPALAHFLPLPTSWAKPISPLGLRAQRSSSSYFLKPDLHSRTVSSDCSLSHGAANPLRDFTGGESEAARRADALRELQEVLKGLQAIPPG